MSRVNAAWIIRQRDLRGWTMADLASILGMSESAISKIESKGSTSTETLRRLRAAFDDNPPIPGMAELLAEDGGDAA